MTDNKNNKDCSTGGCPVDKKDAKLVKSTDLPLLGNPYPPRDVIQNETPSSLELSIASIRTTLQPYMAPVCKAYQKTSDVVSIGMAHSQSAIDNLRESQSSLTSVLVISGAGLLGFGLARRRGFIKRAFYGSLLAGGAATVCYPKEVKEKADILWLIAQNKLAPMVSEQYGNIVKSSMNQADNKEAKTKDS